MELWALRNVDSDPNFTTEGPGDLRKGPFGASVC